MKNFKSILFFILSFGIISNSCKTDFDLLAPYKESVAIYGLLSQSDSVNYIRVNRVFLGKGNAVDIAQIQDSVYFKPGELSVTVEKSFNGVKKQTYVFQESYGKVLSTGAFNPNQLIYKTIQPFKSDSANIDFVYKLVVKNNVTGKTYTASTVLIRDYTQSVACGNITGAGGCFYYVSNVNMAVSSPGTIKVKIGSPVNARVCTFWLRFFYHDSLISGASSIHRYIDMEFPNQTVGSLAGGNPMDFSFPGDHYYQTIAQGIQDDPSTVLCRKADSVNFFFVAGGEQLNLYNEINGTASSFGQEKPTYTNIDNDGVGIFSARYTKKINKPYYLCNGGPLQNGVITYQSMDQLALGKFTCHLRFIKSDCTINTACP